MLIITTWLWGDKYDATYVAKLQVGLRRNMKAGGNDVPFRLICFTSKVSGQPEYIQHHEWGRLELWPLPPQSAHLTKAKGCFARLAIFDPEWQRAIGVTPDDRLVNIDLDLVVTGNCAPLFYSPDPFLIFQGANASNPCPYNGSLWMLRPGYRPDVWTDFSLEAAAAVPFYQFPDDQGWLAHKIPNAPGWRAGKDSGVYAFQKPGWPGGFGLPNGARLVAFPGSGDPKKQIHLEWVRRHWTK